ncbi:P-selectin-like [Stylophora pistillata]|uniref:P-selectin-like n=1 Tax=Stylophora pistillata TaxID=50429 RepID=UPI000C03FED9|nr:P-selectin-like [Stylophora pistillata]
MRNQLYWTDTTDDVIRVSDLEGKNTRILISLGLDEPRGIVLDPERGSMFWTDWGAAPKIETAALNGTERITLVNTSLQWPNGITLDRKRMLVFWVDSGTDTLESINYDGNNRTLLFVKIDFHLFGVTFNSPYIFVSEWDYKSVYKMNISSGTIAGTHYFGGLNKIMGIVPFDSSWQRRGSGSPKRKCQQNGTWSGQEFINCGNQHGTKCNFSCPIGYRLNGSSVITCVAPGNQHPGVWNDSVPTCEVVMCPLPMPPANSVRQGCSGNATEYPYSTECQFSCIEGYTPNGSSLRKCQDNGLWSGGGEFYCERILCESLQLPPSMRTNGSCSPLPGNACQFTCERGLNLIGSAVRWCDKDGSWTGMQPRCEVIACPVLSLPTNGVLLGCNTNTTEMLYGAECRFSCEDGSVATGSTVRRCTENATWTGIDLQCAGIRSENNWNHENLKIDH